MNKSYPWKGTIINVNDLDSNLYKLVATGDADLSGRKYIALPIETNENDETIRKKYNLI